MAYILTICKPNDLVILSTDEDASVFNDFEILQMLNGIRWAKDKPIGLWEKHSSPNDWKFIDSVYTRLTEVIKWKDLREAEEKRNGCFLSST